MGRQNTGAQRWRLALVLCSCAFLAWSIQRAIGRHLLPPAADPEPHEYVITLPAHPAANPAAYKNEIWIHDVVVDGQPVTFGALPRSGSWEDRGWTLIHIDDGQPATVRVRGRRVTLSFLTSSTSGIVRVENERGDGWDIDLYHPERLRTTLAVVDLANGRLLGEERSDAQHAGRTLLMALPLVLIAVLWRPWKSTAALETWAVAYISTLHALVWLTQSVGYNEDAHGYTQGFANFVNGVSSFFPPGYSFFLAPWQALFPNATGLAVAGAQHVAMVITLVALSRVARECLPDDFAIGGLFVAGSLGPTLFLPQVILAENVALYAMAGALWFVCRPSGMTPALKDVAAGVFVGWATLARVVPFTAVVAPLLLVIYAKRGSWRTAAWGTARVMAVAVLTLVMVSSWLMFRSQFSGDRAPREREYRIANSTGFHMFNRVVREQQLLDHDGPMTRVLLATLGQPPDGMPGFYVTGRLTRAGMAYKDIADLLAGVSIEALRRYPLRFAAYSGDMAWREYQADPGPHMPRWEAANVPLASLNNDVPLGLDASSILWRQENDKIFNVIWPLLFWMPIAGLAVIPGRRGRFVALAVLLIPAGYLYGTSSVEIFLDRHVVCVVAFALVLVPAPFVVVPALWARVSRRLARPAQSALIGA